MAKTNKLFKKGGGVSFKSRIQRRKKIEKNSSCIGNQSLSGQEKRLKEKKQKKHNEKGGEETTVKELKK
jgi:hypothetical protein